MYTTQNNASPPMSATSDEARAFVQERVSAYMLWIGLLGLGFWVYRGVGVVLDPAPDHRFSDPAYVLHFFGAGSFALTGLLNRAQPRPRRFIERSEMVGMTAGSLFYAAMAAAIPHAARPDLILTLILTYALFSRAVYVPSTAARTVKMSAALAIPLVGLAAYKGWTMPADYWASLGDAPLDHTVITLAISTEALAWWTLSAACAAGASAVIYGLRRDIRDMKRLGQYTLAEQIGKGGMGAVYRATHAMLRRPTAVKVIPPDKTSPQALGRFEREVQLTAGLTHPNTVTVYDYGRTPEGVFYYAMEYLEGANLAEIVEVTGSMDPARAVRVLHQAAAALVEAHGIGLIHRDLKPANIMMTRQGGDPDVTKVLDFGLVKEVEGGDGGDITQGNVLAGTPQYLAPEAITAPDEVDHRSDLYALGAIGWFLLAGRPVFEGATVMEVCTRHVRDAPEDIAQASATPVPPAVASLIMSCLEKDPAQRPEDAAALRDGLAACMRGPGAQTWTPDAAEAWWAQHGAAIRAARGEVVPVTDTLLAIDPHESAA